MARSASPDLLIEGPGSVIGPYKILSTIGEGGMGTVFLAEQEQPIRRRVALKVIKPGMDSRQVVVRFEAERQALALMDHPNIARVLDAGATATGRPFFVMELVHGVPITDYCDANYLTPRERLELFVSVCRAIQHAHQKGIIHRDIKPNNVMVTLQDGRPEPKVIDFGVAKATEQRLTEQTVFTEYGVMIGTLEYMSPEQAEIGGLDIDTRSDIYSLGVLLYELLTGSTPLERTSLKRSAYVEILRRIRDEEPAKPSTRLNASREALQTISAQRRTEPAKLSRLVRGDLDWIVLRALEKDRTRRYETANGLARDVQRYLDGEPVEASPPSARYKFRKYARKHLAQLVVATSLVLVLVLTATTLVVMALFQHEVQRAADVEVEQREQRNRASKDRADLRDREQHGYDTIREIIASLRQSAEDSPTDLDKQTALRVGEQYFAQLGEFLHKQEDPTPLVKERLASVERELTQLRAVLKDQAALPGPPQN